jgi:Integrase core domain
MAEQESFFGRFKTEFGDPDRFESLADFISALYAAVVYYNEKRIHLPHRCPPAPIRKRALQQSEEEHDSSTRKIDRHGGGIRTLLRAPPSPRS